MELFEGFEIINPDNLDDYYIPGVWAMFGMPKDVEKGYVCLNVGKNICIGEELKIDYERLLSSPICGEKDYVNQFNRYKFTYPEHPTRLDYLYENISQNYKNIVTILVTNNPEHTYIVEKYFAYTTIAEYWVSNGRYKANTLVDSKRIKEIKDGIDTSAISKELIEKIDKFGIVYEEQCPIDRKKDN